MVSGLKNGIAIAEGIWRKKMIPFYLIAGKG